MRVIKILGALAAGTKITRPAAGHAHDTTSLALAIGQPELPPRTPTLTAIGSQGHGLEVDPACDARIGVTVGAGHAVAGAGLADLVGVGGRHEGLLGAAAVWQV
jgi:hypothetical protein